MYEPDIKKYAAEVIELKEAPPITVELPPTAIIAIVIHVQLAILDPSVGERTLSKIAIDTAQQLQNLLDPKSEAYKILEGGWGRKYDEPLLKPPCNN